MTDHVHAELLTPWKLHLSAFDLSNLPLTTNLSAEETPFVRCGYMISTKLNGSTFCRHHALVCHVAYLWYAAANMLREKAKVLIASNQWHDATRITIVIRANSAATTEILKRFMAACIYRCTSEHAGHVLTEKRSHHLVLLHFYQWSVCPWQKWSFSWHPRTVSLCRCYLRLLFRWS